MLSSVVVMNSFRDRIICTDDKKVGANLSKRHSGPKGMWSGGPLVLVEYDQRTLLTFIEMALVAQYNTLK